MNLSDSAMDRLRASLEAPDAGPRFEIGPMLGRGGMGAVYRAHDRELDRDVAIKVLALDAVRTGGDGRIAREAQLLAQLEHPGIVAVYDRGTLADGRAYYVMRLVKGQRLDEYAARAGRGELLRVFLRICDAVAFAHSRGIVHRDLKPGNVMIGEFGEALVLDWGIATNLTEVPEAAGTPGFMAPEQAMGDVPVDARVDVHGLGAILRTLLASTDEPVPRPLSAIVARATAPDASARYADVQSLAQDVRRWLDAEPVSAYREGVFERAGRIYRRNQVLILLLLAYAVVRMGIFLWRGI